MNVQYIGVGIAIVAMVVLALIVFAPEVIPGIEASYYANVKVRIGKEVLQTGNWVEIEDVTFEKKILPISLGGWGLKFLQEDRGTLVIKSFKDGVLVDTTTLVWELGRFEIDKPYTGTVRLGLPGSGQYDIRATTYPEDEASKEDTISVEVPLS